MSTTVPEKYRDLFTKKAFASLGTLMPDGRPQVTPVWCDFDGEHVIFNSAKGRQKDKNVRRDPRVAVAIIDPDNPYRYLEIRGTVVEITEEGADKHIDKMAKKYLGADKYPYAKPGEVRVIYKIRPEHTTVMGYRKTLFAFRRSLFANRWSFVVLLSFVLRYWLFVLR